MASTNSYCKSAELILPRFAAARVAKLTFLLALLCLAGCSFLGGSKEEKRKTKPGKKQQQIESVEVKGKSFKRIPNPNKEKSRSAPSKAKAEFAKALKLMRAKKWKDAESVLVLLNETYPELAGPYVNLGIVQEAQGNDKAAVSSWKRAIRVNPSNFDAYTHLAVHYRQQGRFKEAERVYRRALQVWPHHPASLKNLGVLYDLYMGRLSAALVQYELYLKVIGREDKKVNGWVLDLKRRIKAGGRS